MTFWLPTKPYTLIDAINRMALATGSVRAAEAGQDANYNGHRVAVTFNDFRKYWVAEYTWAGRQVLARGSLADVARAAVTFHGQQGRGGEVIFYARDEADAEVARALGFVPYSDEARAAHRATYEDDRFDEINGARDYERHGLAPALAFLANSKTAAEYQAKLDAHFAEKKARRNAGGPNDPRA